MSRFEALRQRAARTKPEKSEQRVDELGDTLADASALIDDVVAAADRAAAAVRAEVERQGAGRESVIDRDRIVSELLRSLVERTESLRSQSHELARVLERAAQVVATMPAPEPEPGPQATAPPPPPLASPAAAPQPPSPPPAQPPAPAARPPKPTVVQAPKQPPSEGLRLLATQMAVAGSTQIEIEERLRSEFGVADADAILAQVFGTKG